MAGVTETTEDRISIPYFEGVNSTVQQAISLKSELSHAENARSKKIGSLEKREGQEEIGTDLVGDNFMSTNDTGLVYYADGGDLSQGLLRVSSKNGSTSDIYYLDDDEKWTIIDSSFAKNLSLSECSFTKIGDGLVIVNGEDNNRLIIGEISENTEIVDSDTAGSLFNSPIANKSIFYKSRIYLADYFDNDGNELKTTVLRSSYPLGIIALLNGDFSYISGQTGWTLELTTTRYFYTDSGMNEYEVYRGNDKIATFEISSFSETSVFVSGPDMTFEPGFDSFLSSDEIWIKGTFDGVKQYRWERNSSATGRDVKEYDTFKMSGGDESAITLFETVGNYLIIGNKNSIMTWDDYTLRSLDSNIGCCSKNGYVKYKTLYFLGYDGIYSSNGDQPELLSRKVERYISGATKEGLEAGAMGIKGLSIFCTIGDVTLYRDDGSTWKTINNVCLELNTADQNWYVHTNVSSTRFTTYLKDGGGQRLTMNSTIAAQNIELGDELVTNGSFIGDADNWELGDGWAYSGGKVVFTS